MKKITLFLIAALALVSCGTPKIAMDTSIKGDRVLLTSDTKVARLNEGRITFALGAKLSKKDTIVALLVTCDADTGHGVFDRDDRIMFKYSDGSEVYLKNMYDREYESSQETHVSGTPVTTSGLYYAYGPWATGYWLYPGTVTAWVPQVYTTKTTNSYGLYPITKNDIKRAMGKEVVKLRIETNVGDVDIDDPKDIAALMKDLFQCLAEAAQNKKDTTF